MVVRTIEILLEYISIILCIHKVAGKKVKISRGIIFFAICEIMVMLLIQMEILPVYSKIIIYITFLLFIRKDITANWWTTIQVYAMTLIGVIALQLIVYYLFKIIQFPMMNTQYGGSLINGVICLLILGWKRKFFKHIVEFLESIKGFIIALIFLGLLFYFLGLYNNNCYMDFDMTIQFLLGTIGLSIISILWISAENEKKHKAKEAQLYESYSRTFEEAIRTIRLRQHEFENHINAIRCLQFTTKNHDELICAQEKYCQKILKDNSINKLLSLNVEPILIGFLYSKISWADGIGIETKYDINYNRFDNDIELYELIELMGILYDNAVDALMEKEGNKCIFLKLISKYNHYSDIYIEVANTSRVFLNSEIEKFCTYGYSTKGEKRGIGLQRARNIVEKYKGELLIQNKICEQDNYLSFSIHLSKL